MKFIWVAELFTNFSCLQMAKLGPTSMILPSSASSGSNAANAFAIAWTLTNALTSKGQRMKMVLRLSLMTTMEGTINTGSLSTCETEVSKTFCLKGNWITLLILVVDTRLDFFCCFFFVNGLQIIKISTPHHVVQCYILLFSRFHECTLTGYDGRIDLILMLGVGHIPDRHPPQFTESIQNQLQAALHVPEIDRHSVYCYLNESS